MSDKPQKQATVKASWTLFNHYLPKLLVSVYSYCVMAVVCVEVSFYPIQSHNVLARSLPPSLTHLLTQSRMHARTRKRTHTHTYIHTHTTHTDTDRETDTLHVMIIA